VQDDVGKDPCPACASPSEPVEFAGLPEMRYQNAYVWIILVSSLDIILTLLVVLLWEGHEVNPVADFIITEWGFGWAIVFKFALVMLAIVICEVVGRFDDLAGRRLSVTALAISALPVLFTFAMLLWSGEVELS
jgi:hypothetical protein